jgi:hypothetical protein
MMVQAYKPSYLGGGNQEDHSSRPAQLWQKVQKTPSQPMAGDGGVFFKYCLHREAKIGR